jgi:hypothetical protein
MDFIFCPFYLNSRVGNLISLETRYLPNQPVPANQQPPHGIFPAQPWLRHK